MSAPLPARPFSALPADADPSVAAARRRVILLVGVSALAIDLAVVGWLLLGAHDMPQETRWTMSAVVLLALGGGLFLLRRIWQRGGV